MEKLDKQFEEQFEAELAKVTRPNLMIVGGTGVGKSSLINYIFGKAVAKTGTGEPITRGLERYSDPKVPLNIFDTEGYEIADGEISTANFRTRILPEIRKLRHDALEKQIHLIWYCLSVGNHRITDFDLDNLRLLSEEHKLPIAIVLTQCDTEAVDDDGNGVTSQEFRRVLKAAGLSFPVFDTCSNNPNRDPELELDLEKLLEWSAQALDNEALRASFVGAQRASLPLKRKEAMKVISAYSATTAASAGLNPVPMSDALLIVPQQIAMAASLAKIYGFGAMEASVMSLLKGQLVTLVGRQVAASLTKFVPILGQLINAGVAAAITGGIGWALTQAYESALRNYLETGEAPDWAKLLSHDMFMQAVKAGMSRVAKAEAEV